MLVIGCRVALKQHACWLISRIPERVRASARNEHAAPRPCADDSISIGRFPVLPRFLYALDWLERADLEFPIQDVEELFRAVMRMRPNIEARRDQHLETRGKGALCPGGLEGDFLRLRNELSPLARWNDQAVHAICLLIVPRRRLELPLCSVA